MNILLFPNELLSCIGGHLGTRDVSVLSRTCHTLHTVLPQMLKKKHRAESAEIIIWAVRKYRPLQLKMALPLLPQQPDSVVRTRVVKVIGRHLFYALGHYIVDSYEPITLEQIETLRLLLSNGIPLVT